FYKGWANAQRGFDRWAITHFQSMDQPDFPKKEFFNALQTYRRGKLDDAAVMLKALLQKDYKKERRVFAGKVARTLARIHFEKEEYAKSLDIYTSYLLRLNPMTPSDWL